MDEVSNFKDDIYEELDADNKGIKYTPKNYKPVEKENPKKEEKPVEVKKESPTPTPNP